jgi:hypothetical protein
VAHDVVLAGGARVIVTVISSMIGSVVVSVILAGLGIAASERGDGLTLPAWGRRT